MTLAPLRFSLLKKMSQSPAHCRYAMEHEQPDTGAMRLGRLVHALMLGRATPTIYKGQRRGKAWEEFKEEHADEDILTEEEFTKAASMSAAVLNHREARGLLLGTRERTVLFDIAGRACRVTPDSFRPDLVVELKTTADASPRRFPYTAFRLAYPQQLAWTADGLRAAGEADPKRLFIVAVESKPPYCVTTYELTERAEDFGRRSYRLWFEEFLVCERSNAWPGYPLGVLEAPEEAVELVGEAGEVVELEA